MFLRINTNLVGLAIVFKFKYKQCHTLYQFFSETKGSNHCLPKTDYVLIIFDYY